MEREKPLLEALVAQLKRSGVLRSRAIGAALLAVPRHRFVPEVSVEEAYGDTAIALKHAGDEVVSSISQPSMIVEMLELLDVRRGDRVLEIGSGSGYNAALLAELAGASGSVTTVELDAEMCARARVALGDAGYGRVAVVCGDGSAIGFEGAFDRVSVTARCQDIAAAWWGALCERGRIVVPLALPTVGEFVVGFERRGARLRGIGAYPCAFIALRGDGARASPERVFLREGSVGGASQAKAGIRTIVALRSSEATPELVNEADVVVARPVTMFAVRLSG